MRVLNEWFKALLDRHANSTDVIVGARGRRTMLGLVALLFVLGPLIQVFEPFWLNILSRVMIFGLFAISLDLVFGYTGLPSLGHAAMFGVGGYTVALLMLGGTQNLVVVLVLAAFTSGAVAFVVGWFSVRGKELFFAFLTLAFAQPLYIAAFNDLPAQLLAAESITNGDDGLFGVPPFELVGVEFAGLLPFYYLSLLIVSLSVALMIRVAHSEFGRVLQGIRENEGRMAALGYDVHRYKVIGFTISGVFTGIAGALYVPFVSIAHPNLLFWTTSADGVIMVLIGGMGTLWGPMLGAGFVIVFEQIFSAFGNWHLYLGVVYVLIVIFLPKGFASALENLQEDPPETLSNVRAALRRYRRAVGGNRRS